MNILIAASESVPFCKTGGLADVVGVLTQLLANQLGHKVALFLPRYRAVNGTPFSLKSLPGQYWIPLGEGMERAGLLHAAWGKADVYFVDNPKYFDRDELYKTKAGDYPDNDERFIFFSRAVLEGAKFIGFRPDVIHCHDWQTALMPAYLKTHYHIDAFYVRTGTVLTIHNIAYQGLFSKDALFLAGFGWADFTPDKLEYYGGVNFLKAGLVYADALTTVSPTYAREIQGSAEYGRGLEGLLKFRSSDLHGILNGIDTETWNPETDPHLAGRFGLERLAAGKAEAKRALQSAAGLDPADVPLVGIVSRFDPQKGLDLAIEALDALLGAAAFQLAVLGTGDLVLHEGFDRLARRHAGRVVFRTGFDEPFAHQIYAASDIFLMPSRFEPCGLGQMIAMRYGAVPVVVRTGGLADTVFEEGARPNGFVAAAPTADAIRAALGRALAAYGDRARWTALSRNAASGDYSWERSVLRYQELYEQAAVKARGDQP